MRATAASSGDKIKLPAARGASVVQAMMALKHHLFWVIGCWISVVQGYKISCPEGWSGFSESTSCYLFMTRSFDILIYDVAVKSAIPISFILFIVRHGESFEDARENCKNHDASLLIIDTIPEKVTNSSRVIVHTSFELSATYF